jgi:hypothetical protein
VRWQAVYQCFRLAAQSYPATPYEPNSDFARAVDHPLMQTSTAYSNADSVWKICFDATGTVREPYPSKRASFFFANLDSQRSERAKSVRHQALSTNFVYGWFERIYHRAIETFLAQSDCRSQTGGTTTNNQNVYKIYFFSETNHFSGSDPYQILVIKTSSPYEEIARRPSWSASVQKTLEECTVSTTLRIDSIQ